MWLKRNDVYKSISEFLVTIGHNKNVSCNNFSLKKWKNLCKFHALLKECVMLKKLRKIFFIVFMILACICFLSACIPSLKDDDKSYKKWMAIIDHGSRNLYDFHDMLCNELLDSMLKRNSLESNWEKLLEYTAGTWSNFDLISKENYDHGVIAAEYRVYVRHNRSDFDKDVKKGDKIFYLYFVTHHPEEENPNFRGVWSVSIVDDALYHKNDFSFAAKPNRDEQKKGISPCGIFVGEEAVTLENKFETPSRTTDYDKESVGPGYQVGPVSRNDVGDAAEKKHIKKLVGEIEDCMNESDEKKLYNMFSKPVVNTRPKLDQELKGVLEVTEGSPNKVKITNIESDESRGSDTLAYLFDSTGDNHIQTGFGDYYFGFRGIVNCKGKKYLMLVKCCTHYERNANRIGLIKLTLYPEILGGEGKYPYENEPIAEAGIDTVKFFMKK